MAKLGDFHVDGAHASVQVAVAVSVSVVGAGVADGGVVSPADAVCLGGEDLVDEVLQHLPHQIRRSLGEQFIKVGGGVDMIGSSGHRGYFPFEEM